MVEKGADVNWRQSSAKKYDSVIKRVKDGWTANELMEHDPTITEFDFVCVVMVLLRVLMPQQDGGKLHFIANYNLTDSVEKLFKQGCDINKTNSVCGIITSS